MAINLNIEGYGAQFNAFVDFAKANGNNPDTLARIDGDVHNLLDPEGNVRTIVAKTDDDKIKRFRQNLFFSRNQDQKDLNNAVRNLFKETVLKVCGVKTIDKLPPSVLAVMRKSDYDNNGHPLSARRIRAVTQAIQLVAVEEAVNKTVTPAKAGVLVDGALTYINGKGKNPKVLEAKLNGAQRQMATNLVSRFGAGMTDSNLRIFANYVVLAVACGSFKPDEIRAIAQRMSKEFKNLRNFSPGDPRLAEFDATLTKYYQSVVADQLKPAKAKQFDAEGLYSFFRDDTHRASFKVAGEDFSRAANNAQGLVQKLKDTVPNLTHRKVLTSFMCQEAGTIFFQLSARRPFLPTSEYENIDMNSEKGRDLILGIDQTGTLQFDSMFPLGEAAELLYTLDMGEGGNTAKVTVQYTGDIRFRVEGADDCSHNPTGTYSYTLELEFALSDPAGAKVTSAHLGQRLGVPEPDAPQGPLEEPLHFVEDGGIPKM